MIIKFSYVFINLTIYESQEKNEGRLARKYIREGRLGAETRGP